MRLGIKLSQQSHQLLLIDLAGDGLAQGCSHPAGDLRILQGFSRQHRTDDDLAACLRGLGSGFKPVQPGLRLGNLLINGSCHSAILCSPNGCKTGPRVVTVQDTKCPLIQTLRVCVGKGDAALPFEPLA